MTTREEALEAALRKCGPYIGHAGDCALVTMCQPCDCNMDTALYAECMNALALPREEWRGCACARESACDFDHKARLRAVAERVREACARAVDYFPTQNINGDRCGKVVRALDLDEVL